MSNDPIPGTLEALDGITDGTGLNVNKTSEIVQFGEGDANGFDVKLDEILGECDNWCPCTNQECQEAMNYKAAKQAIKQLIASELGAIIDANTDENGTDSDRVWEVLMEWMGELQGGGDE